MQKTVRVDELTVLLDQQVNSKKTSAWQLPTWTLNYETLLRLISLGIVALVILPLLYLALRTTGFGQEGLDYLLKSRTLEIISNSLLMVFVVTLGAALLGVPLAWLTSMTDLPFRRLWLILVLLPMVIPSYLAAVSYLEFFGSVGMLQKFLEALFGIKRLPDFHGFLGTCFVMTLFTYPYVLLPVRSAFLHADPVLSEVGYSMGLKRWQVFWKISLPQLRPALISGMVLAAMYALSDFGAVAVLRYNAFTRAIFLQINSFRMDRAAVLALILVLMTLALLALEWRFNQQTKNFRIGTGVKRRQKTVKLAYWTIPALLFCALISALGVFIPLAVMFSWSLTPVTSQSLNVDMWGMLTNSLSSSAVTALVVAIAAFPLALLVIRHNNRTNRYLVGLAYTGNILPGIVIALALVFFAANYANPLYQTSALLILGYATRFLPYSISATRSALTQINPKVEESARSLGLSRWQVLWRITIPLARTGIIAGAALVFLSAMKELPTTLILRPIGFETFTTRIWAFYQEAFVSLIGLPGLILILMSAGALALILWQDKN